MKLFNHFKNNPATFIIMAIAVAFIIYGLMSSVPFAIWMGVGIIIVLIFGSLLTMRR